MSALNNLWKKGTSLTLGEDECLCNEICKEHKEQKSKALKRKKETQNSIVTDNTF